MRSIEVNLTNSYIRCVGCKKLMVTNGISVAGEGMYCTMQCAENNQNKTSGFYKITPDYFLGAKQ